MGRDLPITEAVPPVDYDRALARVYEHLEEDDAEKAVMGCLRIARSLKDAVSAAIFMRELYPDKNEVARVLFDDTSHLNADAQKYVWEFSFNRWLELHTLDIDFDGNATRARDGNQRNVLTVAVGEIDPELDQWERSISDLALPSGMGEFDTAAFTDRFISEKAQMRFRMKALQTIKGRIKVRCLNYAIQIERQLERQRETQGFLDTVQNDVNNYFRNRSEDVYIKLQKASQLAASSHAEDFSVNRRRKVTLPGEGLQA